MIKSLKWGQMSRMKLHIRPTSHFFGNINRLIGEDMLSYQIIDVKTLQGAKIKLLPSNYTQNFHSKL